MNERSLKMNRTLPTIVEMSYDELLARDLATMFACVAGSRVAGYFIELDWFHCRQRERERIAITNDANITLVCRILRRIK